MKERQFQKETLTNCETERSFLHSPAKQKRGASLFTVFSCVPIKQISVKDQTLTTQFTVLISLLQLLSISICQQPSQWAILSSQGCTKLATYMRVEKNRIIWEITDSHYHYIVLLHSFCLQALYCLLRNYITT